MSTISKVIDDIIADFINEISLKYSIEKSDLIDLWTAKKNNIQQSASNDDSININHLNSLKKSDLINMCKQKQLKCTGNKEELISYIVNNTKTKQTLSKQKSSTKEVSKSDKKESNSVIKKLVANVPVISIHKNHFGNFEHAETGFILNKSQKVIGKQNPDGSIDDLTTEDIDLCNKYKFSYIVPSNLDKKLTLDAVKVDELDEEEKSLNKDDDDNELEIEEEIELNEDDFDDEFETEYADDE